VRKHHPGSLRTGYTVPVDRARDSSGSRFRARRQVFFDLKVCGRLSDLGIFLGRPWNIPWHLLCEPSAYSAARWCASAAASRARRRRSYLAYLCAVSGIHIDIRYFLDREFDSFDTFLFFLSLSIFSTVLILMPLCRSVSILHRRTGLVHGNLAAPANVPQGL
jgi:hypothetical protein